MTAADRPRHSVLCITYNQEAYVEKAITSLFQGSVWPDEVIVGDDCSRDQTVRIIEQVSAQFPGRIRVIRNAVNLGIFENLNQLAALPSGDVVHFLAGDDWYEPGMFERMNMEISRRRLDPARDAFMLAPNSYWSDGTRLIERPIRRPSSSTLFKRALRQDVFVMPVGISRALYAKYPRFRSDIGLWADYLQQLAFFRECEQVYFIDEAFPVYRLGSGISSRTAPADLSRSFLTVLQHVRAEFAGQLDAADHRFLRYLERKHQAIISGSLRSCSLFAWHLARNAFNGSKRSELEECLLLATPQWLRRAVRRLRA
jgi:glycosyl transferase family 2